MFQPRTLLSSAVGLLTCGFVSAAPLPQTAQTENLFRPETLQVAPHVAERAGSVAAALGFSDWPRTAELYRVPAIGRVLFDQPAELADEVRSCTTVRFGRFGNDPWERCVWSWRIDGEKGGAAADTLDLEVTLAPSARAAQEYLLTTLADNTMPTETLVKLYGAAKQPASLGDVAVLVEPTNGSETRLSFTRANVAFRIRGFGALREEVLALAQRLDEKILAQQPLTLEQLRAQP